MVVLQLIDGGVQESAWLCEHVGSVPLLDKRVARLRHLVGRDLLLGHLHIVVRGNSQISGPIRCKFTIGGEGITLK